MERGELRDYTKARLKVFYEEELDVLDHVLRIDRISLLDTGEKPGLFEGDEHTTLMTQCKDGAQHQCLILDTNEELFKWFTQQVMKNLHMVFTMNPSSDGLMDRAATSPALFNRYVLNWFSDWSDSAFFQVGLEFMIKMDLPELLFMPPGVHGHGARHSGSHARGVNPKSKRQESAFCCTHRMDPILL